MNFVPIQNQKQPDMYERMIPTCSGIYKINLL